MTVKLEGADDLIRRLTAVGEPRPLLRAIQIRAVAEAKQRVPRKTGNLGRSIVRGDLTDSYAEVHVNANYAAFVEFGTRAHTIVPRRARVLAWPASSAGRRLSGRPTTAARKGKSGGLRFAKKVKHPGTKPQPFLIPGAKAALNAAGIDVIVEQWNGAA